MGCVPNSPPQFPIPTIEACPLVPVWFPSSLLANALTILLPPDRNVPELIGGTQGRSVVVLLLWGRNCSIQSGKDAFHRERKCQVYH
jgi:hypothetical protein